MMVNSSKLPTAIECNANFPDDHLEENGEIVRASGLSLSNAIVSLLVKAGMDSSTPSLDMEHDSWEFFVKIKGRKFWILVTDMGEKKLIQTEDLSPILKRLFNGSKAYFNFLDQLYQVLSDDTRFNAIRWKH